MSSRNLEHIAIARIVQGRYAVSKVSVPPETKQNDGDLVATAKPLQASLMEGDGRPEIFCYKDMYVRKEEGQST